MIEREARALRVATFDGINHFMVSFFTAEDDEQWAWFLEYLTRVLHPNRIGRDGG